MLDYLQFIFNVMVTIAIFSFLLLSTIGFAYYAEQDKKKKQ